MHGALRISVGVLALAIGAAAQSQRLEAPATVYIVTGGQATALYHRQGCSWLGPGAATALTLAEAQKRYFQPHCLCIAGKDGVPPCEGVAAPATVPQGSGAGTAATAAVLATAPAKSTAAGPAPNATETVYATRTGTKVGFATGDQISFTVNFGAYGSLTAWVGQDTRGAVGDARIVTFWHLTRNVKDEEEKEKLWGTVLTGADTFRRNQPKEESIRALRMRPSHPI